MVYISDNVNVLYLSKSALKELRIFNNDFQSAPKTDQSIAGQVASEMEEQCECKPRIPTPDQYTLPSNEGKHPHLKEWIVDTFSSSAFNTCTHQKVLANLTGEPDHIPV